MALEYVQLWTLADMVEWLLDVSGANGTAEERRKARRVVIDAYREFPQRDEWTYFKRPFNFTTEPSQSDGTIAFDLTGGTHERQVTLSGATWPENARFGDLIIDKAHYPIEDRKSDTVVTLPEGNAPTADIAAGASYTYYRSKYPAPIDYRKGSELICFDDSGRTLEYLAPADLQAFKAALPGPQSWQFKYTIRPSAEFYSGLAFEVSPPPSGEKTYSGTYCADPRPIGTFGTGVEYSTGTVSVSGTEVTGTSTVWSTRMIGCLMRFTTSTTLVPTGLGGSRPTSSGTATDNPYLEQRVVNDVPGATAITLDQSMTGAYSGVKYSIGDPLDLDYHCMLDALKALCEWRWVTAIKSDRVTIRDREDAWRREFARARGADDRIPDERSRYYLPWHPRLR